MASRKLSAFWLLTASVFLVGAHIASAHAQEKKPPTIELGKIQAPSMVWPDEPFQLNVPVYGGVKDEKATITLEALRLTDRDGKTTLGAKLVRHLAVEIAKKTGANVASEIDFQAIVAGVRPSPEKKDIQGLVEGTWEIKATLRLEKEVHETSTKVLARFKKLRVLLFIDGPTREYQFIRSLFARHPDMIEFFVHAKNNGFDPDVEQEHRLTEFPDRLGAEPKDKKGMSLSGYDLVIAIDPDWDALKAEQIKLLEQWVKRQAGGFILVAGPVNTFQIGGTFEKGRPLQAMLPVVLRDYRLMPDVGGVDVKTLHSLTFTPSAAEFSFLKLDATREGPLAGWDHFFWGETRKQEFKFGEPDRGVYHYYPVDRVRPATTVLATFDGPQKTYINQGKDPQPFFASMPYGTGKTFFISSGETWRLRQFKESYHERFWLKLARYMSAADPNRVSSPQMAVQVLIVDGDPVRAKDADKADSYYVQLAIDSITANPYEVDLAHELAAKVLERDDLGKYGAILLLNVRSLNDKQLANLEKYAADGGGVGFFLGPKVSSTYYNETLFKKGKGLFPVPLESTYYPPKSEPMLKREASDGDMVLLRFDLFPKIDRYPVFGPLFRDKESRGVLKDLPIGRYFKVPREQWKPDPERVFELATLPNDQPAESYLKTVHEIFFSQQVKSILEDPANMKYVPGLLRHRTSIVVTVAPNPKAPKRSHHVAQALDNLLRDRGKAKNDDFPNMTEFWASKDAKIQKLRADVVAFLNKARFGDPLVVGARFGKGRVLAVMTTAGPDWNDWAAFGKCLGSFVYQPFIWESVNFLADQPK